MSERKVSFFYLSYFNWFLSCLLDSYKKDIYIFFLYLASLAIVFPYFFYLFLLRVDLFYSCISSKVNYYLTFACSYVQYVFYWRFIYSYIVNSVILLYYYVIGYQIKAHLLLQCFRRLLHFIRLRLIFGF
jgi:hypothetical protein